MPVPRTDALFDRPRALGVRFEQTVVIVRLHKQAVEAAQALGHAAGDVSGVRDETRVCRDAVPITKPDRIHRIMLDGETPDHGVADGECLAGLEGFPNAALDARFADDMGGLRGREHRHRVLFQENLEAAHVVAVLVGEQDAVQRCRIDPQAVRGAA